MNGLINTFTFIQENWSNIVLIAGIIIAIVYRTISFFKLSKEQKIEAVLKIVKSELLKFMSDAEIDWEEYKKSGLLKKSDVITKIYNQFPILSDYVNQDLLIQRISEMIDQGMAEMNQVINKIPTSAKDIVVTENK